MVALFTQIHLNWLQVSTRPSYNTWSLWPELKFKYDKVKNRSPELYYSKEPRIKLTLATTGLTWFKSSSFAFAFITFCWCWCIFRQYNFNFGKWKQMKYFLFFFLTLSSDLVLSPAPPSYLSLHPHPYPSMGLVGF